MKVVSMGSRGCRTLVCLACLAALLPGNSFAASSRLFGGPDSQDQTPRGRPIQFSGGQESVSTNLNNLPSKPNSFDPLQRTLANAPEDLPKLEDGIPLTPVRPPNARQQTDSKKVRDLLERRKNWIFMNGDDFLTSPQEREAQSRLRGDKETKQEDPLNLTPAEKFFLKLNQNGTEKQKTTRKDRRDNSSSVTDRTAPDSARDSTDNQDNSEDVTLPESLKEREVNLRSLLGTKDFSMNPQPTAGSGLGGLGSSTFETKAFDTFGLTQPLSTAELQAKKTRDDELRQYRELLGLPGSPNAAMQEMWKPPSLLDEKTAKPVAAAPVAAPSSSSGLTSFQPKAAEVQFGAMPGLPNLTDFSPKSAFVPTFGPTTAMPQNSTPILPPAPSFNAPKRMF